MRKIGEILPNVTDNFRNILTKSFLEVQGVRLNKDLPEKDHSIPLRRDVGQVK